MLNAERGKLMGSQSLRRDVKRTAWTSQPRGSAELDDEIRHSILSFALGLRMGYLLPGAQLSEHDISISTGPVDMVLTGVPG